MVLVDYPQEMEGVLQGFVTWTTGASVGVGRPLAGFDAALWNSLSNSHAPGLVTEQHPEFDRSKFWSSFFLAGRASVSQYDILRRVISEWGNLPGHVACLALAGDGFHGQHGRSWQAQAGNIHLTVGLTCDLDARDTGLALTMLPAVAVMDALQGLDGADRLIDPGIKWVNDILVGGKKLGGVLSSVRTLDGRIKSAVLGIGLNVKTAPSVSPTPFTPRVTCLKDHLPWTHDGLSPVLTLLLEALASRFEELEKVGPGPLLSDYRSFSLVLGRECEVRPDDPGDTRVRRGRVMGIGADLALTLSDGPEPVTTGRLVLPDDGTPTPG